MKILFLHNNFPAQFRHIAAALARRGGFDLRAIGSSTASPVDGVQVLRYAFPPATDTVPRLARNFAQDARRGEGALAAMLKLKAEGFVPDLVIGHPGWGECLPVPSLFPESRLALYCEYFHAARGQDYGFDPEFHRPDPLRDAVVDARNATTLLALSRAAIAWSPTQWQRSLYPASLRARIAVAHEGIDTEMVKPQPDARLSVRPDLVLTRGDEVLTYVARNLEPMRGFHIFLRSLPRLLAARPKAQVVVIGGDGVSYGPAPAGRSGWKDLLLEEVRGRIDERRVHFMGRVPYATYLSALAVSRAHIYLTYPFVASWSLLEAMAAGCVVIASDTAPVREFISDSETGLLTPFFDPDALADRAAAALAEPERFASLGVAARALVASRYDLARHCLPRQMALLGVAEG